MPGNTRIALIAAFSGLGTAAFCSVAAVMSGLLTRWGLLDYRSGLMLLKWAVYAELAALTLSLAGCISGVLAHSVTGLRISAGGLIISIATIALPVSMGLAAKRLPMIHDISTDTENPPLFDKVLPLRKGAPNTAEYGGPDVAEKQRQAYPDIAPLSLSMPPGKAFGKALEIVGVMDWDLANASPDKLIIEATDTTFWFGFKDDIVIRVSAHGGGSRVDVRSVSRVGKSDIGTNAKRIRAFMDKLRSSST